MASRRGRPKATAVTTMAPPANWRRVTRSPSISTAKSAPRNGSRYVYSAVREAPTRWMAVKCRMLVTLTLRTGRTAERPIRAPVEDPVPADSSRRQGFEQELAQAATHALNAGLGAPPV
jgi:hypothetical protein